jgi:cytochrome c-type biogenesis protein
VSDGAFLLALTAGGLAAVNPCGFALLPAYLSLLVVGDRPRASVGRALGSTAAMTAGFVAVFGGFGLLVAPAAGWLQDRLPWFTVGFGLSLVGLGGALLAGRRIPVLPRPARAPRLTGRSRQRSGRQPSLVSMALFGAAYALASLSCTIGPFLAIVVSSLRAGSTVEGIGLFIAYALGMGLVVGVAALSVGLVRTSLVRRLRRAGPAIARAGGALVALAGAYVAYYGWYEMRLAADARGALGDPVVGVAERIQRSLATALEEAGVAAVAAAFALLLVAASVPLLSASWRRPR